MDVNTNTDMDMDMDQDDSCRICRSGPEPDAPLYHPCKCTGSIRHCHQECLVEWLQHSRKKHCELCLHPFIFHKKYRKDMPSDGRLPRYLYLRRLVLRTLDAAQLAARAVLVGFTWLALLPYININVWRFLFWSIDVATWMGVPGSVPPFNLEGPPPHNATRNVTHRQKASLVSPSADPLVKLPALFARSRDTSALHAYNSSRQPITVQQMKSALRAFLGRLANDCFQGQILSCLIVVFFVGVFLLREWILQNIPQHFDHHHDAGLHPAPVEPLVEPAAQMQPQQPPQAQVDGPFQHLDDTGSESDDINSTHQHELDLDPEAQREQARQARLRRLAGELASGGPNQDDASTSIDTAPAQHADLMEESSSSDASHEGASSASTIANDDADPALPPSASEEGSSMQGTGVAPEPTSREPSLALSEVDPTTSSSHQTPTLDSASSDEPSFAVPFQTLAPTQRQSSDEAGGGEAMPTAQDAPAAAPASDTAPEIAGATPDATADAAGAADDRGEEDEDAWEDESNAGAPGAEDAAALRAAAVAAFPPPIAHPAFDDEIEVGAAVDADDPDAEIGLAEEMDGILEAIGMRGPLFGIVQNLFLVIFLCAFVMLAFVMAPYIVGRVLGSGPGLVRLLATPVRLLRYVTDPVFDALIALGANRVWPKLAGAVARGKTEAVVEEVVKPAESAVGWMYRLVPSFLGSTADGKQTSSLAAAKVPVVHARTSATAAMLVRLLPASVTSSSQWTAVSASFDAALLMGLRGTLDRLAAAVSAFFARLDAHRGGTSAVDRAFCVAFGHGYWLLVLFVYQRISKPDLRAPDASALKMFLDQHVLILKAVGFIFIELAVFPLGCGLLLDVCTMPLLSEASVWAWPMRVRAAPLTFAFTRWMGGTIYMFVFAQYVSATRRVLRPGVLCWIRDPNDPNFHPIREILDKRTSTQLRKIGASALMYAAILVASVGVNSYALRYAFGWTHVLPLRWRPFDVLTEVPVDLLLVHFALPWATQRVDPDAASEKWMKAWWCSAAKTFRLSSYLIGGDFLDERRVPRRSAFAVAVDSVLRRRTEPQGGDDVEDGGMCRVPADDKAITTGPLIIPLDADGEPRNERLAEAVAKQEAHAESHTPKPTYTSLYLPSNYTARITAVLLLLWLTHCAVFMLGLGVPLWLGRALFAARRREVHDVYAFVAGLTLLWTMHSVVRGGGKMWARRKRRAKLHRTSPTVYLAVHVLVKVKRVLKAIALLVGVAGIVPVVVGLVVEQYIVVPLRDRGETPVRLGHVWACGVIEARLALFAVRHIGVPEHGWLAHRMAKVDEVLRAGLYPRANVRVAWTQIVLPTLIAGVLMLGGPVLAAYALVQMQWVNPTSSTQEYLLQRKVFGVVQTAALAAALVAWIRRRMDDWTDVLKDEVFLESTVLKNYADANPPSTTPSQSHSGHDEYAAEGTLPDVLFR